MARRISDGTTRPTVTTDGTIDNAHVTETLICGVDGSGNPVRLTVDGSGKLNTAGGGGGGGGAVTVADGADVALGAKADAAAGTDTATASLIGLFKRLLQKLTTQLPTALISNRLDVNLGAAPATVTVAQSTAANLKVDASGVAVPVTDNSGSLTVDASSWPLPTGASTETTLGTRLSESDFDTKTGALTEAAPGTDTASSGLNGRLQRIAQRLTSVIALLPSALVSGRFDVNIGAAPAILTAICVRVNKASTLTRPANQTAYTVNDALTDTGGTIQTLTGAARVNAGGGAIRRVTCTVSSNAATKPQLRVWIYNASLTPQTDNAAFTHTDGQNDTVVGWVDLLSFAVGDPTSNTGNFVLESGPLDLAFVCAGGDSNLYFVCQVLNAYTAGSSSDTYKFNFNIIQD